jgi:hypothetical protein
MSGLHDTVDGHAAAGPDDDDIADSKDAGCHVGHSLRAANGNGPREKIEKIVDGTPSSAHRHVLEQLGDEHEEHDDDRGKRLSDG